MPRGIGVDPAYDRRPTFNLYGDMAMACVKRLKDGDGKKTIEVEVEADEISLSKNTEESRVTLRILSINGKKLPKGESSDDGGYGGKREKGIFRTLDKLGVKD